MVLWDWRDGSVVESDAAFAEGPVRFPAAILGFSQVLVTPAGGDPMSLSFLGIVIHMHSWALSFTCTYPDRLTRDTCI